MKTLKTISISLVVLASVLSSLSFANAQSSPPTWKYITYLYAPSHGGTLKADLDSWCSVSEMVLEGRSSAAVSWAPHGDVQLPARFCEDDVYFQFLTVPFAEVRLSITMKDGRIIYKYPSKPVHLPVLRR